MASHQARGKYTAEFKLEAVRQVKSGQAISIVSRVLNVPKASLGNWVRQDRDGELGTTGDKPGVAVVTPEQIKLSRLRAENARLRMERDIAKKAAAYFAQDTLAEVRLDIPNEAQVAGKHCLRGAADQCQRVFHLATQAWMRASWTVRTLQR